MRLKTAIISTVLALSFSSVVAAKDINFGTEVDASKVMKISALMEKPQDYLSSPVTIKGTIVSVCQKRGCWMTIASDKRFQNLRIKVKDGDMVFPLSAKGSEAIATGHLKELKYSLKQTRQVLAHRAKEAGEKFDPASVTEPMTMYQLVPTGVSILDQ